jgi:hypothetical protein
MIAFFSANKVTSGEVAIFFGLFSHTFVFLSQLLIPAMEDWQREVQMLAYNRIHEAEIKKQTKTEKNPITNLPFKKYTSTYPRDSKSSLRLCSNGKAKNGCLLSRELTELLVERDSHRIR